MPSPLLRQRLSIDCSFAGLTLALHIPQADAKADSTHRLYHRSNPTPRASDDLHVQLHSLLAEAATDTASLELVAVTTGPGSFTGIRLGLVVAQALQLVHPALRITGLPTLPLLARQYQTEASPNTPFTVLLNAAGGQVYAQTFNPDATPQAPAHILDVAAIPTDHPLYIQSGLALPAAPAGTARWFEGMTPEVLDAAAAVPLLHIAAQPAYLKPLAYRTAS